MEIKFYGAFVASSSTLSTRRLLDGVACSTQVATVLERRHRGWFVVDLDGNSNAEGNAHERKSLRRPQFADGQDDILNMLPIPVLDGGHTVMGLIEGIFRRKIPAKLQEWATTGFAVALISLMLYVTFHDVFMRRGIFVDMFNNEAEVQAPADPSPTASE